MARNRISKPAKLRALSTKVGVEIVTALTRGNTDHRIDAYDADGNTWRIYRDGTVEQDGHAKVCLLEEK